MTSLSRACCARADPIEGCSDRAFGLIVADVVGGKRRLMNEDEEALFVIEQSSNSPEAAAAGAGLVKAVDRT